MSPEQEAQVGRAITRLAMASGELLDDVIRQLLLEALTARGEING